jgi:hypothetical protein
MKITSPSPAVEDPAGLVAGAGEGWGEGGYDFSDFPLTCILSPQGEESKFLEGF